MYYILNPNENERTYEMQSENQIMFYKEYCSKIAELFNSKNEITDCHKVNLKIKNYDIKE